MIDEREEFMEKWLNGHNPRDDSNFYFQLFALIHNDCKMQEIFLEELQNMLNSSHENLDIVFRFCVSKKDKRYTASLVSFLTKYFEQKKTYILSSALETYLIHNIWTPALLDLRVPAQITPHKIIVFLTLKMRSLNLEIRKQALHSLYKLVQKIKEGNDKEICMSMSSKVVQLLPEMIQKQKYGKQVCYYRGIILQILEDQFCCIKKMGIEFLGLAYQFYDIRQIRPLILYMLNDEHEAVREASLTTLSLLPYLELEKEDLNALLICLRQNNIVLRSLSYQILSKIHITSGEDLLIILSQLFDALLKYKEDKRKIYLTCAKIGARHSNLVQSKLSSIYNYTDNEEPNWKNLTYKARLILVACAGKWPTNLPRYFSTHYLYIRDIEIQAFQSLSLTPKPTLFKSSTSQFQLLSSVKINSNSTLLQFLRACTNMSTGFLKDFLSLTTSLTLEVSKQQQTTNFTHFSNQYRRLSIIYNLNKCEVGEKLVKEGQKMSKNHQQDNYTEEVMKIMRMALKNQEQLSRVQQNIFKTSSHNRSRIIISNNSPFIERAFIQFSNSLGEDEAKFWDDHSFKFIRMREVEFEKREKDGNFCYFTLECKWKRLRCLAVYGDSLLFHVMDSYTIG